MKVFHSIGVGSYSGKNAQGVFMPSKKQGMSYLRQFTYPRITEGNHARGAELQNLAEIYKQCASGYIEELKLYALAYNNLPNYSNPNSVRTSSAFAIFVQLCWNLSNAEPGHLDLATITFTDLTTVLDANTNIAAQVDAGYLLVVPGYTAWTTDMV